MDRITANLPARDFNATIAFYAKLGFVEDYRDPHWMILARGPLVLEFFPYPDLDPASSSFSACVRVDDLDALYAAWGSVGLPPAGIPRVQGPPHAIVDGLRMFAVVDLDGSLLRCLGEDR
jgi:catechol 2,3-dioxygenase-like lactoylglutathione lyase family enzyme